MPESAASIKGIEFEIRGSATKAANGLEKLSKSLSELKKITAGNAGLASLAKDLASFGKSVENLSSTNIKNVASSLGKIGKQSDKIWEVAEYLNTISMLDFSNLSDAAKNISAIGQSTKTLGQTGAGKDANWKETLFSDFGVNQPVAGTSSSTIREACKGQAELSDSILRTNDAANTTVQGYRDMSENLDKLTGETNNAKSKINVFVGVVKKMTRDVRSSFKRLAKSAKSITTAFAGMSRKIALLPFKKSAESIKDFASKILSVGAAFKRILYYRMIRTLIKEIGAAFRTGVNNLYAWSQMADGRFAASMDRMATSMLYFKNSIGAMVAPLLNSLAPALDYVIDKVVDFLNVVNQLFSALTGATYWTKAIKQATTYSDAASSAGSAAKDAMKYLAAFDELNVLPSDNNGGSGGGADNTDYSGMFTTEDVLNQYTDWANTDDWIDIGTTISNYIADGLENAIEWMDTDGVALAQSLGTRLATFLNGAFQNERFARDLGEAIGSGINLATSYITTFDETTNWDALGQSIASALKTAVGKVEWVNLGKSMSSEFRILTEILHGFVTSWTPEDAKTLGTNIAKAINAAWNNVSWSTAIPDAVKFATRILETINSALDGITLDEMVSDICDGIEDADWQDFWDQISEGISNLANQNWEEIGTDIGKALNKVLTTMEWGEWIPDLVDFASGVLTAINKAIEEIEWGPYNKEGTVLNKIYTGLKNADWDTLWEQTKEFIKNTWPVWTFSLAVNFLASLGSVTSTITTAAIIKAIAGGGSAAAGGATAGATGLTVVGGALAVVTTLAVGFALTFDGIKSFAQAVADNDTTSKILSFIETHLGSHLAAIGLKLIAPGASSSVIDGWALGLDFAMILNWNGVKDGGTTVDENGHSHLSGSFDVDVTGNVTELQDQLPENKREISTYARIAKFLEEDKLPEVKASAKLKNLDADGLTESDRTVNNVHGNLVKLNRANLPKDDTTIPTTANYTDWEVNGSKTDAKRKEFTTWSSTANWTSNEYGSPWFKKWKSGLVWNSTANWTSNEYGTSWFQNWKTRGLVWNSTANWTSNEYGSPWFKKWETEGLVWDSTANWNRNEYGTAWFQNWRTGLVWDAKANWSYYSYGNGYSEKSFTTFATTAKFTNVEITDDALTKLKNKVSATLSISAKARGGIFSGGVWHSIPQYAGGTSRAHGSLFIAGEAGPEIVGHIGGRTEVLNQSQIAASISAGMARALSNVRFHMSGISAATIPTHEEDEDTEELMFRATVRALQYLGISGDIAAHISEDEVYESVKDSNRRNTRRTGINELARA